jgi:hypothetical protein
MITTKITGLSAQGSSELRGLAYSNNDVAVTMYSDNVTEPGFKYVFNVVNNNGGEYKFYISPNAQLNGVFNVKTLFNQLVPTPMVYNTTDVLMHISEPLTSIALNVNNFIIQCFEGWEIGGVFTEEEIDAVEYGLMCVYGSGKQNFIVMGTNDTKPLALSQMYDNTLGFNAESVATELNLPLTLQNEVINWRKISRSNVTGEEDSAYSILSFIADDGSFINTNYPYFNIDNFLFELYDETSTIIETFNIPFSLLGGGLYHLPTGLKNLVNGGYVDQSTADSTKFYTVVGVDADDNEITAKYGYWVDQDCKYNPVHLYWLNQLGGWDSFSFIKKNERSIDIERKRYKTYSGDYNNATTENPFSTEAFSRSLTEREPIVKTYLNLTSDWLTESEFRYLKDLFRSKSVWMVDDNTDGYSVVPVVVEDNNYLMRRERNSHKYNQNIRLQIANDNETLNITASEYPIPAPVACTYFDIFTKIGGNTGLNIGANLGSAANIVLTAATRDQKITVSVQDSLGNTPIAGQTYYVRIDYNVSPPATPIRMGYIDLGNVTTGGGTRTSLQGMQTPGTPIIATGVWGTGNAVNYFVVMIPGWGGGGTMTGNIYVTVGFGNCP